VGGVVLPGRWGSVVGVVGFVVRGVVVVGAAVIVKVCGVYSVVSEGKPSLTQSAKTGAPCGAVPAAALADTVNEPAQDPFARTGMRIDACFVGPDTAT